ncbi:dihydropteroate synthase [Priestia koreensis]|uniref:dihydropteroate synthase n=1 Tax=Priestia koreensis TaxID=284581 RepID=UPI001F5ACE06|nr:dihydropteroate synthase [Priestia koreensis]MCM3006934.1 dihydropteroate synthase [Priestia koreensis]UNL85101.1 dihydropteroate synthase [Priestia koreensis]
MVSNTLVPSSLISCGDYTLNHKEKTLIMGILNMTPDSFSDGGKYNQLEVAVKRAQQLVEDGADIIDIGGESTRPGYTKISDEEEIARVTPVIASIRDNVQAPISIDTYKSEVARSAVEAGAHIINDIWGAKADPKIAEVAASYNVPIVLMHNRDKSSYNDLIPDMIKDLNESIEIAKRAGVKDEQIILDPGIGFAKGFQQNLEVMRNLHRFKVWGYPVLLGTSRKSMIGRVLDLPPEERAEGTAATVALGIEQGIEIMRVHDVLEISRFAKMMDVLVGKGDVNNR